MSDAPARCPFCGSDKIGFSKADVGVDCGSVGCEKCQCEGPIGGNENRAIAAWNRRDPAAIVPDPANAEVIQSILDEIVIEINDPRTLPAERTGLRIAHVIVRRVGDRAIPTRTAPEPSHG